MIDGGARSPRRNTDELFDVADETETHQTRSSEWEVVGGAIPGAWRRYDYSLKYVGQDPPYGLPDQAEPTDCIYFIHAPALKMVKIGFSSNVAKRYAALQGGSPAELILVKRIPGGRALEKKLHYKFAEHRKHGEWFDEVVLRLWNGEAA